MLKITNLNKKFRDKQVISNLNINIDRKEKICIFAPSGSGKTTFINILTNSLKKDSGEIKISAENQSTIFQKAELFWYKTLEENIFYPFKLKKIKITEDIRKIYHKWLEITNLKDSIHLFPHEISGGMQQKVSVIRGLLFNPDFIIMDEPFNSIDLKSKTKIIEFIKETYSNSTILFVTHNLDEIPLIADKILLFNDNFLGKYSLIEAKNRPSKETIDKIISFLY